jgi:hypothetical protein
MTGLISLKEAAAGNILRGLVTAATLRRAADRGELTVYRIGKRIVTTEDDINQWWKKCRVNPREQGYISGQPDAVLTSHGGSSETDRAKLAQTAVLATARALKGGLPNISSQNTNPPADIVLYRK